MGQIPRLAPLRASMPTPSITLTILKVSLPALIAPKPTRYGPEWTSLGESSPSGSVEKFDRLNNIGPIYAFGHCKDFGKKF